jgi:amino acid permease
MINFEVERKVNKRASLTVQHAQVTGASLSSCATNIAKQQAGTVFLTFADAVNRGGSVGWCIVLLALAVSFQCASACAIGYASDLYKATSYQDLYEKACGKRGLLFVQLSIVLNAGFGCVGYCIVVKEYTSRVFEQVFGVAGTDAINLWICAALVFFPLAMKADLNMLRFSSALGLVCIAMGASFVLWQLGAYWNVELESRGCGDKLGCSVGDVLEAHNNFSPSGLMGAAVLFIGGMMSHYNIPRLYSEFYVKDPAVFARAVKIGFSANFFIYLVFAVGGFLRFGTNKPTGNLIKFYDHEHEVNGAFEKIAVVFIWILMAVQVSTSYPLLFNPMRRSFFGIFGTAPEKVSNAVYTGFTGGFVVMTVLVALGGFNLTIIMILKGAICGVALCYLVPGAVILSTAGLAGPAVRRVWGYTLIFVGVSLSGMELAKHLPSSLLEKFFPSSRSLFLPQIIEMEG